MTTEGSRAHSGICESFPAEPESVAAVRAAVRELAQQSGGSADAVALAASEAASNVIMHAYHERDQPGEIELIAVLTNTQLTVTIRDSGSGLKPKQDSPGLGLGLAIIARTAEKLDLRQSPRGGLEVEMQFVVPSKD